jgi:hypothetical protein
MGDYLAIFIGLPGLVLYVMAAAGLAWWLLEPINRVAGRLQMSTRFMLTDVLGLMALLQLPLAIAGRALEADSEHDAHRVYWFFLAVTIVLAVVLWVAAVSVVSRAGITRLWRRLCVIVLLVPGATAVIILWPIALALLVAGIHNRSEGGDPWSWDVLSLPGLLALGIFVRVASFWVLKGSPGEVMLAERRRPHAPRQAHGRAPR